MCAAGAPSLVNNGGHVGATDLLSAERGEIIEADLAAPIQELAAFVEGLLADRERLGRCGAAAAESARSWTEAANAASLVEMVADALRNCQPEREGRLTHDASLQYGRDLLRYCSLEHLLPL